MLPETLIGPANEIAAQLVERGQTIAVAESSAGGLISASLLAIPGASRFYRGGIVFYNHDGLRGALGGATDLDPGRRGACEQLARYLAPSTRAKHASDWGIGETGASGPDGNPYGDPAGHTWVSVAGPGGLVEAENLRTGQPDRVLNMEAFAARALQLAAATIRAT